jgi:hypothetical protein
MNADKFIRRSFVYIGEMDVYDRELSAKSQKLESIKARLAQHEKTARLGLMWLSAIGDALLALLGYGITRL